MRSHGVGIGLAMLGAGMGAAAPASAQTGLRSTAPVVATRDTVVGRARPGYAPIGISLGAFRLYPSLETRASYDSNIYALPNAPVDDAALLLTPRVAITSIENRAYALSLVAEGTVTRYANQTIENNESVAAVASGRLELGRDTQLATSMTIARRIQRRGTEEETLVGVFPPIAYREISASVSGEHRFGPISATLGGTVGQFRYEPTRINGARVPLDESNFQQAGANARVVVPIGPAFGVFAAGSYNEARYAPSTRLPTRDSSGYTLLGGVAFGTPLINAEAGVGYIRQSFDAPVYGDISGINYAVRVDWSPLPLVDVGLDVARSFQRSALIGAAGIRVDRAALTADYELLRNLLVNVGVAYVINDYRGLDRRERRIENVLGVRYLANGNLSFVASIATVQQQRASGSTLGRDYDRLRVTAGARLQL